MPTLDTTVPYFGEILALMTALVWALAVILFRKSGETVHPIALNTFKNVLAFILFIPTMLIMGFPIFRDVPLEHYLLLIASGVLGIGIADTLFLKSLNLLGAGLQSIVNCMYAPSFIFFSMIWLGETMTIAQIFGTVLIISAVLTAVSRKRLENITPHNLRWGIFWGVLSHLIMAVGIVMIKRLLEQSPLLWATEIRLLGGIATLFIILLFHPRRRKIVSSIRSPGSIGYSLTGSFLGTYLAMMLLLGGMKYAKASIASALNQMSNIFIFILAVILLKEPVNLQRTIGIILGVTGAILVTFG